MAPAPKGNSPKPVLHGTYCPVTRVYQSGGDYNEVVYWKRRVIPVHPAVWSQILKFEPTVERLEFVIHDADDMCYSVGLTAIRDKVIRFNDGIGERVGLPIDAFKQNKAAQLANARPVERPVFGDTDPAAFRPKSRTKKTAGPMGF
jgi:hypothetical protein